MCAAILPSDRAWSAGASSRFSAEPLVIVQAPATVHTSKYALDGPLDGIEAGRLPVQRQTVLERARKILVAARKRRAVEQVFDEPRVITRGKPNDVGMARKDI